MDEVDFGADQMPASLTAINGSEKARPTTQHACTTRFSRRSSVQLTNSFGCSRHRMHVWSDDAELTLSVAVRTTRPHSKRFCRAGEESTGNCGPVLFERSIRAARKAAFVRRGVLPGPAQFSGQTARARRVAPLRGGHHDQNLPPSDRFRGPCRARRSRRSFATQATAARQGPFRDLL